MKKFVAIKCDGSSVIWNNETEQLVKFGTEESNCKIHFDTAIEAEAIAFYLNDKDKIEMNNIFSNIKQDDNDKEL